ncbi:MAG: DNA-directed RNA polymerase subunit beta' [Bifidobacteriaceae bacterium]|jgi:DNA-directed RNA polymerase subunit beta'|nr:DNA-directed RNA polymerase subunit beta' [Bifidobacteriaceae bacterium]
MINTRDFSTIELSLADSETILGWSYGEVKNSETINYRSLKAERDGLFAEQIFGPTHDYECACGKYKRVRYKGIICERCGVEVTKSSVRKERMGHISLVSPVTHVWFLKGVPSRIGHLLDISPKDLDKVIYFAAYMVTEVDEKARHDDMSMLRREFERELKALYEEKEETLRVSKEQASTRPKNKADRESSRISKEYNNKIKKLERLWEMFQNLQVGDLLNYDQYYGPLVSRYGDYFKSEIGAEAIMRRLEQLDLQAELESVQSQITKSKSTNLVKLIKRQKILKAFIATGNKPSSMVLTVIPVIPPDLRPMIQLDGGRFTTSDLNELYRRVIIRNNRLKRMQAQNVPEIIINYEKRVLQESVDALFDNGRRGRAATGTNNRPLKSISDSLKGKQGRFRQNLLGKRVDYSGRSVIVVGPTLKIYQCGLPKQMALELFTPFVMKRLIENGEAQNIRMAKRFVEVEHAKVWDILDEVIKEHPVLLNRAPTLHRLGIQAFEPILVEGKAIHLHPLTCAAFNADFDGDQMAVHLPLSAEAQAEARVLMLAANNVLKPADGKPITTPTQDMIIGVYSLTDLGQGLKGEGRIFSSIAEAEMAYDLGQIQLNSQIKIRFPKVPAPLFDWQKPDTETVDSKNPESSIISTTYGRVIFNQFLPKGYPYLNLVVNGKTLTQLVDDISERYTIYEVDQVLDALKENGFKWSTKSGLSIAFSDIKTPPKKDQVLDKAQKQAEQVTDNYDNGLITDIERRQELIDIWTETTDKVGQLMEEEYDHDERNNLYRMVWSGARGNMMQVRQIAGMRGLVANPKGEIIPRPIKSNYRDGLSVLEYFIASHGARKGLADTALRTADSGFLTRRLVDVVQGVIVRELDCKTKLFEEVQIVADPEADVLELADNVLTSAYARTLAEDIKNASNTVIAKKGDDISRDILNEALAAGITHLKVRSVSFCESDNGVCAYCYGRSMATGRLVDVGEAVGVVAAQSIGEPGTQLTLRTFHSGGVASADDITQGLPRVVELFEARNPKAEAFISEHDGTVALEESPNAKIITVTPAEGKPAEYIIPANARLLVKDQQVVRAGDQLNMGAIDPKKILRILGWQAAQKYIVEEVQKVYRDQGVDLHDKHIEVIVRQMERMVNIVDGGGTDLIPGDFVDKNHFREINKAALELNLRPAIARPELLGITQGSLATESWLSAASFQETTRVLIDAAISNKRDALFGLKENVIIGRLIPAGTGIPEYENIEPHIDESLAAQKYPALTIPESTESLFLSAEDIEELSSQKDIELDASALDIDL